MQYVIQCRNTRTYYTGPCQKYLDGFWWNSLLTKATVFDTLEQAKDMHKILKGTYYNSWLNIFEYNPPTLGKVVLNEKNTLISDLELIKDAINSGDMKLGGIIKGVPRTIDSAIKFIERNVNE
jgi:hypothetical protein